MDSKKWLERVGSGASVNAMAKAIGVSTSTLDSQMKSSAGLKPETVVALAREYGYSPVAALVDLGLIAETDARAGAAIERDLTLPRALSEASDEQLLREIGRRLEERAPAAGGAVQPLSRRRPAPATRKSKASRKDKDPDA